jgi:hypothetical protein
LIEFYRGELAWKREKEKVKFRYATRLNDTGKDWTHEAAGNDDAHGQFTATFCSHAAALDVAHALR